MMVIERSSVTEMISGGTFSVYCIHPFRVSMLPMSLPHLLLRPFSPL